MNCYENDDPLVEVHHIRAGLLEEYGGIDGYVKHIREDLSQERLEKEGWSFVTAGEIASRRRAGRLQVHP
jgi:hypothetical protein